MEDSNTEDLDDGSQQDLIERLTEHNKLLASKLESLNQAMDEALHKEQAQSNEPTTTVDDTRVMALEK